MSPRARCLFLVGPLGIEVHRVTDFRSPRIRDGCSISDVGRSLPRPGHPKGIVTETSHTSRLPRQRKRRREQCEHPQLRDVAQDPFKTFHHKDTNHHEDTKTPSAELFQLSQCCSQSGAEHVHHPLLDAGGANAPFNGQVV